MASSTICLLFVLLAHSVCTNANISTDRQQCASREDISTKFDLQKTKALMSSPKQEACSYHDGSPHLFGYMTPWNGGGARIAKVFSHKFNYIAPVWFQVR